MLTRQQLSSLPEYLTYDDVLLLPNYSDILPFDTDVSTKIAPNLSLELPIIASPMDTVSESRMAIAIGKLGGLGIVHRNLEIPEQAAEIAMIVKAGVVAAAAVGAGQDLPDRLKALLKAGVSVICIDSAHGHSMGVISAVKLIKKTAPDITIIAGNVATYEGAMALFEAGADSVKIGMGPGSICTTRIMSGMGVPQLSAVVEGVRAAHDAGKTIIADGGIRASGDIVKALAAGAHAVMLGSMLAGTDEAPGDVIQLEGKLFKSYRGMGSIAAMKKGSASRYSQKWQVGKTKRLVAEGVEGLVPHRGPLEEHIYQLTGGVRAGMGYLGAKDLQELAEKANFIRISDNGKEESRPHSIVLH